MVNKEIVEKFYNAFSNLDYPGLAGCLSEDIVYFDPVYGLLEGSVVFSLWEMRCMRLAELKVKADHIEELDDEYTECNWEVSFFHRAAAKIITMQGKAYMRVVNGKITEHSDGYRISKWLAVSQGVVGKLFGWTGYLKRKEQNNYRKMLDRYISNKELFTDEGTISHDSDFSDR